MQRSLPRTLMSTLSSHLELSKSRLETLAFLLVGMVSARTVNLSHLSSQFPGNVQVASSYRRLQRFFQHVQLSADWSGPLVVKLLGLSGPWLLCLDRTNWKIGQKDINILMLAVVTRRFRIPLLWTVLDKAGTSNSEERMALMRRYLALFGASSIKALLGDREFIGADWIAFLLKNDIPFALRLKDNMNVVLDNGQQLSLRTLLCKQRIGATLRGHRGRLAIMDKTLGLPLSFAAKRIKKGELLILATTLEPDAALKAYKKRWAIECLFGDVKTRGFNLEDTRLRDPRKLDTLLVLLALAVAWAAKVADKLLGRRKLKTKIHGFPAKSFFRTGFDTLRRWLLFQPRKAALLWIPLRAATRRVV